MDLIAAEYREWLRDLGRSVAERRRELGWTQAEAAARCGLDFKYYQDVEYGRRPLTTRSLFGIARGLETTVSGLTRDAERDQQTALRRVADASPAYDSKDAPKKS